MNEVKENKQEGPASTRQGGFLKLIIFIIIVLFLIKYFDVSITDVLNWFKALFNSVF